MKAALLAALLVVAGLVASACSPRNTYAPASDRTLEDYQRMDEDKEDIRELWMQIREWRVEELGLSADPTSRFLGTSIFRASVRKLRVCSSEEHPRTNKCQDACQYKDAICDNAERICRIASRMPDDNWATEKCNSAKASCREARERCCGCIASEPEEPQKSDAAASDW